MALDHAFFRVLQLELPEIGQFSPDYLALNFHGPPPFFRQEKTAEP
jgi:hypothetical protein